MALQIHAELIHIADQLSIQIFSLRLCGTVGMQSQPSNEQQIELRTGLPDKILKECDDPVKGEG